MKHIPASPVHLSATRMVGLLAGLWLLWSTPAAAQIDAAGHHPRYHAELEPHLVWQWTGDEAAVDDGIGFGFRASIPILQDGPISTINNNLAISFGLDWAYFPHCSPRVDACDENDFWVPVTLQWNFFLTSVVSLFPEFGLGFRDAIVSYDDPCNVRGCHSTSLEVHPVLWFGARFTLARNFAIVTRLGVPSLQLGAAFTL